MDSKEPYLSARNNPPLRIPEGMSAPDRSSALPIPPESQVASTRRTEGCLADPPSYFRSSGTVARSPEEVIASWAQAWANREAEGVMALYSARFIAPTDSAGSAAWLAQRREQVAVGPVPASRVEDLRIEPDGADRRIATFKQRFGTNVVHRELVLVREAGSWRILEEKVVEVR
ncbi:MAG TPA: nuclear transport factor 2 family protein [Steroidobacteraceae bacterium]